MVVTAQQRCCWLMGPSMSMPYARAQVVSRQKGARRTFGAGRDRLSESDRYWELGAARRSAEARCPDYPVVLSDDGDPVSFVRGFDRDLGPVDDCLKHAPELLYPGARFRHGQSD